MARLSLVRGASVANLARLLLGLEAAVAPGAKQWLVPVESVAGRFVAREVCEEHQACVVQPDLVARLAGRVQWADLANEALVDVRALLENVDLEACEARLAVEVEWDYRAKLASVVSVVLRA